MCLPQSFFFVTFVRSGDIEIPRATIQYEATGVWYWSKVPSGNARAYRFASWSSVLDASQPGSEGIISKAIGFPLRCLAIE